MSAVIHLLAHEQDMVITIYNCSMYLNPPVTNITGDPIVLKSGRDNTQFILSSPSTASTNQTYRFIINQLFTATTATFQQLKDSDPNIPSDAIWVSGPELVCESPPAWILYSVVDKKSVPIVNNGLPPPLNTLQIAVINLDYSIHGAGNDSHMVLSFPAGEHYFDIQSTPNNTVYAIRISNLIWKWTWQFGTTVSDIFQYGLTTMSHQLPVVIV